MKQHSPAPTRGACAALLVGICLAIPLHTGKASAQTTVEQDVETCDSLTAGGRERLAACSRLAAMGDKAPTELAVLFTRIADNLYRLGRYAEALSAVEKAVALKPNEAKPMLRKGWILKGLSRPAEAHAAFMKVVEFATRDIAAKRTDYNAYSIRADALYEMGEIEKGMPDATKAIEVEPQNAGLWLNRGFYNQQLENHAAAISDIEQAMRLSPQPERYLNQIAQSYIALKQYDKAIAACEQAEEKRSGKEERDLWCQAYAWRMKGNLDKAEAVGKRAHELNPDSKLVIRELINVLLSFDTKDKTRQAVDLLERLAASGAADCYHHYLHGSGLEELGRTAEAITAYKACVGLAIDEHDEGEMEFQVKSRERLKAIGN